jgi:hypothetical protein
MSESGIIFFYWKGKQDRKAVAAGHHSVHELRLQ